MIFTVKNNEYVGCSITGKHNPKTNAESESGAQKKLCVENDIIFP